MLSHCAACVDHVLSVLTVLLVGRFFNRFHAVCEEKLRKVLHPPTTVLLCDAAATLDDDAA